MARDARSIALTVARVVAVVLVVAFLVRAVVASGHELRTVSLGVRAPWLVAAAAVQLAAFPLLPLAWRGLVRAAGHPLGPRPAIRIWSMSQVGRFVPSALPAFVARAHLSARVGVPGPVAAATMVVEIGLLVLVGAVIAVALLPVASVPTAARVAVAAVGLLALALVPAGLRRSRRWTSRVALDWRPGPLAAAEALFCLNAALKGVAFVLFAAALLPVGTSQAPLLVGALNASVVLGTVGVTPAGLGVREGAMAALLDGSFGLGDAAALAVAYRGFELAVELIWLGVVQLPTFRRREGADD